MSGGRGVGVIGALQRLLPDEWGAIVVALTQLGDVWFTVVALALIYWFADRRNGAFMIATALGALALTVLLKGMFALPRPPVETRLVAVGGYGFPSGHAIAATVTWGGLAAVLDVGTRRRRIAAAAGAIGIVVLSRVALGVHYAIDVVAGVTIGLAYLAALLRWGKRNPETAFAVATAIGALAVIASGGGDAGLLFGGAVGGLATWHAVGRRAEPWRREGIGPALIGGALIGGVIAVGYRLDLGLPFATAVGAVSVSGVIALPAIDDGVRG